MRCSSLSIISLVVFVLFFSSSVLAPYAEEIVDSCTDTDGYNVHVKGKVYGYENGVYYKHWDFCNFTDVIEYYCDGNSYDFEVFDCTINGTDCYDGACVFESTAEGCSDSDGGKNYYVKGTATDGSTSLSDHCNPDGTLTEKYCSGDEIKWHSYDCPGECINGACIKLVGIETEEPIPVEAHICTEEEKEAEICTMGYEPVCGYSNGKWETYGNACGACVSGAEYLIFGECEMEELHEDQEGEHEETQACNGCVYSSEEAKIISCLDYGTRIVFNQSAQYCDINGEFSGQKSNGESCQNNYECVSNFCSSGECYDIRGDIQETQGLVQAIMDFFKSVFGFE